MNPRIKNAERKAAHAALDVYMNTLKTELEKAPNAEELFEELFDNTEHARHTFIAREAGQAPVVLITKSHFTKDDVAVAMAMNRAGDGDPPYSSQAPIARFYVELHSAQAAAVRSTTSMLELIGGMLSHDGKGFFIERIGGGDASFLKFAVVHQGYVRSVVETPP